MKVISSLDNQVFKDLRTCLEPKGIKKLGMYFVSGKKFVQEALLASGHKIKSEPKYLIALEDMELPKNAGAVEILVVAKPLFNELDLFGTKSPLLVLNAPKLPAWNESDSTTGLELLCALGEPSNLGACLRSAAAFGASRVVLLKECATPFHPKAIRAAAGATLTIELAQGPSIQELKGSDIYALDMKGESLAKFKWPKNARLLLGQEGPGLPADATFKKISIPMSSDVESLNATVAASCALFSYRIQNP